MKNKNEMSGKKPKKSFFELNGAVQFICFAIPFGILITMPILLFDYSSVLGIWWSVLLTAYSAALTAVLAYFLYRKEMHKLKYLLGEELFYKKFPKERKRR